MLSFGPDSTVLPHRPDGRPKKRHRMTLDPKDSAQAPDWLVEGVGRAAVESRLQCAAADERDFFKGRRVKIMFIFPGALKAPEKNVNKIFLK